MANTPSHQYCHESTLLRKLLHEGKITPDEYSRRLEEAQSKEADRQLNNNYKAQVQNDLSEYERAVTAQEEQKAKQEMEAKQQAEALRRKQELEAKQQAEKQRLQEEADRRQEEADRRQEEAIRKANSPEARYKTGVPSLIARYQNAANNYRKVHNFFQGIIIIGSVLVTGVVGFSEITKWLPFVLSLLVSIAAGFTGYFKYRERSFNLQRTAGDIDREYKAVELGIGVYEVTKPEERLILFSKRVEDLINEQRQRELQLDQPPNSKSGQNQLQQP